MCSPDDAVAFHGDQIPNCVPFKTHSRAIIYTNLYHHPEHEKPTKNCRHKKITFCGWLKHTLALPKHTHPGARPDTINSRFISAVTQNCEMMFSECGCNMLLLQWQKQQLHEQQQQQPNSTSFPNLLVYSLGYLCRFFCLICTFLTSDYVTAYNAFYS